MIESTKLQKILYTLKNTSSDSNIDISIVDYDTAKECDYEVLILYLKETNTQNGASVYKKFIIRSQLYYDPDDNKYYSALDGDIIVGGDKAFSTINIITQNIIQDDFSTIKVRLIDKNTQEPIKSQSIFMYMDSVSESIMSAITNKNGEATFKFKLSDFNVFVGERLIHFKYKGNHIYQQSKSKYISINFDNAQDENISTSISAYIEPNETLVIRYDISLDNKNLYDAYNDNIPTQNEDEKTLVDEESLLAGRVLFFIDDKFLGESILENESRTSYSQFETILPADYYNKDVNIRGVFEGNTFFSSYIASMPARFDRTITATNITLTVDSENVDDGFRTSLSFDIDDSLPSLDFRREGFDNLYRLYGQVWFYLENANQEWGTIADNFPFYIVSAFEMTENNGVYTISTGTDDIFIDRTHYALNDEDEFYIKAVYIGNAIINPFEVDNKPRSTQQTR